MSDPLGVLAMIERLRSRAVTVPGPTPEQEEAERRRELAERLVRMGVPRRAAEIVASPDLRRTASVVVAERLARGEGCICVLAGGNGRGKTVAGGVAVWRRPGLVRAATALARPFPGPSVGEDPLQPWIRTKMLVIDDLGMEHSPGGYAASELLRIVNEREGALRPTLITTNLTAQQARERYGDRLMSRLAGDPLGWQQVVGADLRREPG